MGMTLEELRKRRYNWLPEAFDAFWTAYPRKESKVYAMVMWDRLKALMALGCLFTGSVVLEALLALASALAECLLGWGGRQMALVLAGFFLLTGVPASILAAAASAVMVLGYPVCRHLCGYIRASLAGDGA